MKISRKGWFAISILISITSLAFIFISTFNESTIYHILSFSIPFLVLAISFHFIALLFWGLRVKLMARSLGYHVGFFYCVNLVLANLLVAALTPGMAGGEPVRVHELYRAGVPVGDATALVIMERILDGVVLTVMGIVAIALMSTIWWSFPPSFIMGVMVAWVVFIGILALPVLALRYPKVAKGIINRVISGLARRFPGERMERVASGVNKELDNMFSGLQLFTGRAVSGSLLGLGSTALFWLAEFLVPSMILMGLGYPPSIAESFFFQIIIAIVMMIPTTPGASGVAEISTSYLYSLIIPASVVGIFVLIWRVVTFYLNIVLGAISSLIIIKREMGREISVDPPQIDSS
ncbi:MAG: flippase-like domain-containing protein [Methanomicrobiales archaeon]|jgi:hypothetical protein|nr:flippase-like domain-containing protein [Methanomicrobiales archaeon]